VDSIAGETCDQGAANSDAANAACRTNCRPRRCGDGIIDAGETCDDGNTVASDGCGPTCLTEGCGNGYLDPGEQCDEGAANANLPDRTCRTDCTLRRCGDGVVDQGEGCDEGAANSNAPNAACRTNCQPRRCGDGVVDAGETCDRGTQNANTPDALCRTDCTARRCGDGVQDSGEGCDLGAANSNLADAACRTNCQPRRCGDGIRDTGESCDSGATNSNLPDAPCRPDCTPRRCGDGVVDTGELCDGDGGGGGANSNLPDAQCRTDCQPRRCGDGIVDQGVGELCDLGGLNSPAPNAQCRTDCQPRRCGDGVVDAGETCDLGAANSDDPNAACRTDCTARRCGDWVVDSGETCDLGDQNSWSPGAKCRPDCTPQRCGDGILDNQIPDPMLREECDAGAANSELPDAACRSNCKLRRCGDGVVDTGETCDLGVANSNVPNAACRTDCLPRRCGDGVVDTGETCDLGASNSQAPGATCRMDCTPQRCGDGVVDPNPPSELCDAGAANSNAPDAPCRTDCQNTRCGDGIVDAGHGEECDDANQSFFDGCGDCLLTETMINTTTYKSQEFSDVAHAGDGQFVLVWQSYDQDGSKFGIYGQRFTAAGGRLGDELQVNTYYDLDQSFPRVAVDDSFRFVVVWHSQPQSGGGDDSSYGVYGRLFAADGSPAGAEFLVNTTVTGAQAYPRVGMTPEGRFVVGWYDGTMVPSAYRGQRFAANGSRVGGEFNLMASFGSDANSCDLRVADDGSFVVAFGAGDGYSNGVFAQSFDDLGLPADTRWPVNTYLFNSQSYARLALTPAGQSVVVWQSSEQDGEWDQYGVFGQRLDADLVPVGAEFRVNTNAALSQEQPRVAMAPDGRYIVVFTDWSGSHYDHASGPVLLGRLYESSGIPLGTEFRIHADTHHGRYEPEVSMAPDGSFVVTWSASDISSNEIFARRFDRDGLPLGIDP
jgi:cysteine-rich repeat protein